MLSAIQKQSIKGMAILRVVLLNQLVASIIEKRRERLME